MVGADVVVDAFAGDVARSRGGRWSQTSLSTRLAGGMVCSRRGRGVVVAVDVVVDAVVGDVACWRRQ